MGLFLIIQRELRALARTSALQRFRFITVLAAVLAFAGTLPFSSAFPNTGRAIFGLCTFYCSALIMLGGSSVTADLIARERREGTLGFLFLTDLNGLEVVMGKFMAAVINPILTLMAVVPIAALSLLFGGVQFSEFWLSELGLFNFLLFAASLGLLLSCFAGDGGWPASKAVGLLVLISFSPWLDALPVHFGFKFAWFSPLSTVWSSATPAHSDYIHALLLTHGLSWIMLVVAGWRIHSAWREADAQGKWTLLRRLVRLGSGSHQRRGKPLLDNDNPIRWLAQQRSQDTRAFWLLCLASALLAGCAVVETGFFFTSLLIFLLFVLLMAMKSARFFAEARRSGAFEVLLITPLTDAEILVGYVKTLHRAIWPPLGLSSAFFIAAAAVRFGIIDATHSNGWFLLPALYLASGIYTMIPALIWTGTWLSLKNRRPERAGLFTILVVVVAPTMIPCIPRALINLVIYAIARSACTAGVRKLQQALLTGK